MNSANVYIERLALERRMTYHYEALGDERFQKLAQALISAEFPNVQCLPVGQPDGGRDAFATVTIPSKLKADLTIFQVKFSRDPSMKHEREVITNLIKDESSKINELKTLGATSYILITNVSGTSHLKSGSIDQVNSILSAELQIPAYCWWRDDLDAKVNNNSDVKWSFPEILKGSDILQLLIEGNVRDAISERNQIFQSYIASQCQDDLTVKFKQVDLQNKLLDLFVDTPVAPITTSGRRDKKFVRMLENLQTTTNFSFDDGTIEDEFTHRYRRQALPDAATLLLSDGVRRSPELIVLEGAPGQGKSTISQVCLPSQSSKTACCVRNKHVTTRTPGRTSAGAVSGRSP